MGNDSTFLKRQDDTHYLEYVVLVDIFVFYDILHSLVDELQEFLLLPVWYVFQYSSEQNYAA